MSHGLGREGGVKENLSDRVIQIRLLFAGLVMQADMVGELTVIAKTPDKNVIQTPHQLSVPECTDPGS